jgi:hypothetical protein
LIIESSLLHECIRSVSFFSQPERTEQRDRKQDAPGDREGGGEAETVDQVTDDGRENPTSLHSGEVIDTEDGRPVSKRRLSDDEAFRSGHPAEDDHPQQNEHPSERPSLGKHGEQKNGWSGAESDC